jgi:diguanylate cyclase (GGDEF)-like protein
MNLLDILSSHQSSCIDVNENLEIVGFSSHLRGFFELHKEISTLQKFITLIFDNNTFQNRPFVKELITEIQTSFGDKKPNIENRLVINNLKSYISYQFSYGLDHIISDKEHLQFRIVNFKVHNDKTNIYNEILKTYHTSFERFKRYSDIGRFVLDLRHDKNNIFADKSFASVLGIKQSKDNFYLFTRHKDKYDNQHFLTRDPQFFKRVDFLLEGNINQMEDEWFFQNRWIKLELKVLKYTPEGEVEYIGGIVYDITEERALTTLKYINQIYELAINTGQIGIFFYDIDKHEKAYFDANYIYANLIGIDQQDNGLYLLKDFESSLLSIEEEIQEAVDVKTQLDKILAGEVEGSDNQILKIKHQKTGEIKYFLSSSRIEERYEDDSPRKLGGIIMDITERIQMQKKQALFAYSDELTGLPNKRKLIKDLSKLPDNAVGIFFDLDNFKKINDTYGHQMGDQILAAFGKVLQSVVSPIENAEAYRLYGDEFFAFIPHYNTSTAEPIIKKLKTLISKIHKQFQIEMKVDTSYGMTNYTKDMDLDEFIKLADYAMYQNKISKKMQKNYKIG